MSEATDAAAIRQALQNAITAYGQIIPVEDPNRNALNLATLNGPYIGWEINYLDSEQKALGSDGVPVHDFGQITFNFGVKEGAGEKNLYLLRDFFTPYLERQVWGSVQTRVARRLPAVNFKGFYHLPLLVAFWSERTTAS